MKVSFNSKILLILIYIKIRLLFAAVCQVVLAYSFWTVLLLPHSTLIY